MSKLKETQIKDIQTWLKDTSQSLPESIKNIFIEDCFEGLENDEVIKIFNKTINIKCNIGYRHIATKEKEVQFGNLNTTNFKDLNTVYQSYIIQTLLSRADSKVLMPFLGVEVECLYESMTLDHLLYREFTEALRVGKTLDESLEKVTKIYIQNIYV